MFQSAFISRIFRVETATKNPKISRYQKLVSKFCTCDFLTCGGVLQLGVPNGGVQRPEREAVNSKGAMGGSLRHLVCANFEVSQQSC